MRKLAVLLVTATMLFGYATADEILFRGAKWGDNPAQVRNALDGADEIMKFYYENGSLAYPSGTVERLTNRSLNYWYGNYDYFSQNHILVRWCNVFHDGNGPTVGGYNLHIVNMYFGYDVDGNNIIEDEKQSFFAAAEYTFDIIDGEHAYNDILDKLTTLYGNPERTDTSSKGSLFYDGKAHPYTVYTHIGLFNGDNGTHAELVFEQQDFENEQSNGNDSLQLIYWCDEYENKIKIADNVFRQNEINQKIQDEHNTNSEDYDGL